MPSGGARPGAGRKPNPLKAPVRAAPKVRQGALVPAEAKQEPQGLDPRALASLLPQIAELSQRYAPGRRLARTPENSPFKLPTFPPQAVPKDPKEKMPALAMDSAFSAQAFAGSEWGGVDAAYAAEGLAFLGFTYLAELAQRPEYRTMAEIIAEDATRRWIDFDVVGDKKTQEAERAKDPAGYDERMADPDERKKRVGQAGKADRVKALKDDQERLEVQQRFFTASTFDSWMGRSHLYLQIGDADFDAIDAEMGTTIGNGLDRASKTKVTPATPLKRIQHVEAMWAYPLAYNANNPLAPDWYNPQTWYVMGRKIHVSRMPTFVSRPVPDMLKPSYAFGGLPLTQLAKPYVDIWLQTRQSVADLIRSFSIMVLMTDLQTQTAPGNATALLARVALFNMLRDNQGAFVVNKNTEDFKNVSAPLGGLHELQAQAQEHMLSVARIPAVKFTGIQPAGLNASSEGEIKVYDDSEEAYQQRVFDPNLTRIINFQMLSLWGEVDDSISHRWEQLRQLTDEQKEEQRKKQAESDDIYVGMGAIGPDEVRSALINDPESRFAGLDPNKMPEPPVPPGGGGGDDDEDEEPAAGGSEGPSAAGQGGGASDAALPFDAEVALCFDEFREDEHPRGEGGKFTAGAGSSGKSPLHTEKNRFRAEKHDSLRRLGLKPKKRGNGASLTQSAQVAWHHAQREGKDQVLYPNGLRKSWDFLKPGASLPIGAQHVVVTPDGDVTSYLPDTSAPEPTAKKDGPTEFGGLYKRTGEGDRADHDATVEFVLKNPPRHGVHYRNLLGKLIRDEEGTHSDDRETVGKLKAHLGQAYANAHEQLKQKASQESDPDKQLELARKAVRAFDRAKELGWKPPAEATRSTGAPAPVMTSAPAAEKPLIEVVDPPKRQSKLGPDIQSGKWSAAGDPSPEREKYRAEEQGRLVAYGKEKGTEDLGIWDVRGNRPLANDDLVLERGARNVQFTEKMSNMLMDPANDLEMHHNHPGDTSFSSADLHIVSIAPGMSRCYAHGHRGSTYVVTGAVKGVVDVHKVADRAGIDAGYDMIRKGLVDMEEANHIQGHAVMVGLQQAGAISGYECSPGHDLAAKLLRNQGFVQGVSEAARRSAERTMANPMFKAL